MNTSRRNPVPSARVVRGGAEARFWVRVNDIEVALEEGQTLIGRGEDCDIRIRDDLVSRRHARILRQGERLLIQDLGSANGIYINESRVYDTADLAPGDHLFVGTCEINVYGSVPDEDRLTDSGVVPTANDGDRPTPTDFSASMPPLERGRGLAVDRRSDEPSDDETQQADGLEYMGRLADKMFTMGRTDAARRILGTRLQSTLESARRGRTIEPSLVDVAGRYALKLAAETLDGKWIDLALELHTISKRPLADESIQQLAGLRAKAPIGSVELLVRYESVLRSRMSSFGTAERILVERITCLLPATED